MKCRTHWNTRFLPFAMASLMFFLPAASPASPTVNKQLISWPDDGWYQVQDATNYETVCEGGRSCEVDAGRYIVINHTSGERYADLYVYPEMAEGPVVVGNTISWPDDGWYQVQRANDYVSICEGGRSCAVEDGLYTVINHSSGKRFDGIEVVENSAASLADRGTVFSRTDINEYWWANDSADPMTRQWISPECAAIMTSARLEGDWFDLVAFVPDTQVTTGACPVESTVAGPANNSSHTPNTPFITDPSRGDGPPSVPENLQLFLSSDEWIEFSWDPSSDDQEVVQYLVYRDGVEIFKVRGDTGYSPDLHSWLNTSFIDCNRTRYSHCETIKAIPGASYSYSVVAVDNEGLRSGHSEPALFSFEEKHNRVIDLNSYKVVLDEEFDGNSLNPSIWKTVLPWGEGQTVNGELQHYVNIFNGHEITYDPFVFTGETLQITGIETPAGSVQEFGGKHYLSGVITTADHLELTYGYVEMKARLAGGQGVLSSFFLFNQYWDNIRPEIDIVEYLGAEPGTAYQTYHYYERQNAADGAAIKHSSPTMIKELPHDLSAGFHTYGVLWEPGVVVWFIDGQEVQRMTGPMVPDEPMNIIAQLIIGSDWIGAPTDGTIPAVFEIDYIRAWQK